LTKNCRARTAREVSSSEASRLEACGCREPTSLRKNPPEDNTSTPASIIRIRATYESVRSGPLPRIRRSRVREWTLPDRSMYRTPSPGTLVVETTFLLRTSMPVLHLDAAISPVRTSLRQSRPDAIHRNHRHVTAILLAKIHPANLYYPAPPERPLVEFRSCLIAEQTPSRADALQAVTVARVRHTFPLSSPNLQLVPVSLRSLSRVSPFRLMIKALLCASPRPNQSLLREDAFL
jgi:hypothetical protein